MPRLALVLVVALAAPSVAAGCRSSAAPARDRTADLPVSATADPAAARRLAGRWALDDASQTVMEISARPDGGIDIRAWATAELVPYRVSEVAFDGRRLRARFYFPQTRFKTHSNLAWVDEDTLEGRASGDSTEWEVWRRLPPGAGDAATPGASQGGTGAPAAPAAGVDAGTDAG